MRNATIIISAIAMLSMSATGMATNTDNNMCENEKNGLSACEGTRCCNVTIEESAGIRKALNLYCEASVKGDSKIAKPAFAPTATMSYVENGKLVSVPIQALFDYYDQAGPQPASYEIEYCYMDTDVAVVAIDSKFGDTRYSDMFTLAKDGNDWKIISKVYHVK